MSRRLVVDTLFANLLAVFMLALMLAGCGVQQSLSERPNWSLNGPERPQAPTNATPTKHYGDWSGPGAPKPLTYDNAR